MLSLLDCSPDELRAIASFRDTGDLHPLAAVEVRPVIEWDPDGHDKLIGFERFETMWIYDGENIVGMVT